ncbi:MAG: hypothetical protein P9M08_07530 [Candidatus Erginobacter occultus]|nr:hypothetical protein [Candidatus Erginobacter occultus]
MEKNHKIDRRNIVLATICCREKDRAEGLIPAVRRYRSRRIGRIAELAGEIGLELAILSGLYGLIDAEEPIPYYDRLMEEGDIARVTVVNREYLRRRKIDGVIFCLPDPAIDPHVKPYLKSMEASAAAAGCGLKVFLLPPYPGPEEVRSAFGREELSANG